MAVAGAVAVMGNGNDGSDGSSSGE